ncbi:PREDICTED: 39S ribosomal protein L18, mitochondrial-like [Branchiostoma belcheri]|uniref:Large ribosomal subunit protein uL18m n=1 Tax=Branchiostoma belcheri TaxID=7741 RepID=A0A6P4XB67_BRABE|nr:PREDICTED: 39S ribosomal protein L18, mitochondrial-like [Branchiostoma belcheri]
MAACVNFVRTSFLRPTCPSLAVQSATIFRQVLSSDGLQSTQHYCPTLRLFAVRRLATQTPDYGVPDTEDNDIINPNFINRNPRNLERMGLGRKERGWKTTWPKKECWHRCHFVKSKRYMTGYVQHHNGHIVASASSFEWPIRKHLYSTSDVSAAENIGHVLAQRCLEAGIHFMEFDMVPHKLESETVQRFQQAMVDGGMMMSEPRRIYDHKHLHKSTDYDAEDYNTKEENMKA